jgi:hypothetical protein
MNTLTRAFLSIAAISATLVATEASATNYTLWIHGRNTSQSTQPGNYADFSYWGSSGTAAGVNKKAVNWSGIGHISDQNYRVRDALDCFCTGSNWCYIAAHSAGDLQIGYALAMYGGSARSKKNATPNSSGVCGNTDGTTQTGWNIKWVDVASGASGGSELADSGSWATGNAIDQDLVTTTSRAMYDHSSTRAIWFYNFAGASGTLYSAILPGQDDEAVAYHSTGGVAGSSGGSYCNPSDWLCNDLTLGTAACEGNHAKWGYHTVDFRDDNESYNHYTNGSWGGIVSVVRNDVVTYAQ